MYAPQAAFFSELFGTRSATAAPPWATSSHPFSPAGCTPHLHRPCSAAWTKKTPSVSASTSAILAVITVTAVFFAKETAGSSLEHDRVLDEALQK